MDTSEIFAAIHQGMRKMIFDSVYIFPLDTVVESSVCYEGAIDGEGKWGTVIYLQITLSHKNFNGGRKTFTEALGSIPYPSPPAGETQLFYNNGPEEREKADEKAKRRMMKILPELEACVVDNYLKGAVHLEPLRAIFNRRATSRK